MTPTPEPPQTDLWEYRAAHWAGACAAPLPAYIDAAAEALYVAENGDTVPWADEAAGTREAYRADARAALAAFTRAVAADQRDPFPTPEPPQTDLCECGHGRREHPYGRCLNYIPIELTGCPCLAYRPATPSTPGWARSVFPAKPGEATHDLTADPDPFSGPATPSTEETR